MSIHDLNNLLICPEDLTIIDKKSQSYIFTNNLFESALCVEKTRQDNSYNQMQYIDCSNDIFDKKIKLNINKDVYSSLKYVPPSRKILDLLRTDLETFEIPQRFQMKKECYDIASKTTKDLYLVADEIVEPIKPYELCDILF